MAEQFTTLHDEKLIQMLMNGAIGVLPTDTIYGIVTKALSAHSVDHLYEIRKRSPEKPSIILIASIRDLATFFANPSENIREFLDRVWPGKVSVILDTPHEDLAYLHKGTDTMAFRIPDNKELVSLLEQVGPLIAPSANLEGQPPATTIDAAKAYFGEEIDFYVDAGKLESEPSTVVRVEGEEIKVIRQGLVDVSALSITK